MKSESEYFTRGYFSCSFGSFSIPTISALVKDFPITKEPVGLYKHWLFSDVWGYYENDKRIGIIPMFIKTDSVHYARMMEANLSFPIIVCNGFIIDGVHRLLKAIISKNEYIFVRHVSIDILLDMVNNS